MTSEQPSQASTESSTFVLCVAIRVIQGVAAFLPVSLCMGRVNWGMLSAEAVAAGAISSGMALGVFADRRLRSLCGPKVVVGVMLSVLTAGLLALCFRSDPEFVITVGFFLGIAVGTEWSTISDLARRSLSTSTRWKGVRIWTVAFFAGIALPIVFHGSLQAVVPAVTVVCVICLVLTLSRNFGSLDHNNTDVAEESASGTLAAESTPPEPNAVHSLDAVASTEPASVDQPDDTDNECDATECCGGSKPWRQTSFGHGVLLSTVGWTVLFAGLLVLVVPAVSQEGPLQLAIIGCGFLLGAGLIFSSAPATGYAVAMLPFFVVAIISCVGRYFTPSEGWQTVACVFVTATSLGAIHCGVKLMIGELFSDCSSDPLRTRIIASSLFAASIAVPTVLVLQSLLPAGPWKSIPLLLVLISGIAALRCLPSPVISSMGEDDPDVPDDELQDVMATINN